MTKIDKAIVNVIGFLMILALLSFTINTTYGYNVDGYVTDLDSGVYLNYTKVNATVAENYTNASGYYKLTGLSNGTYTLHAYKFSYQTTDEIVTIAGDNVTQNITLNSWLADPSTSDIETVDESGYEEFYPALTSFDYTATIYALAAPFVAVLGNFFFLILFGTPFIMAWIRQANIIIPVTLGFTIGGLLIVLLPVEYQGVALLLLIVGFAGVMFGLFKERF